MDSRITYFKLVPKQTLGPFLTLSIKMDQNAKLSFSRVNIFTIYIVTFNPLISLQSQT